MDLLAVIMSPVKFLAWITFRLRNLREMLKKFVKH